MDGRNLGYEYHGLGRGCIYFAALDCIAVRTKFRAAARMMLISAMGTKADISVPNIAHQDVSVLPKTST